MDAVDRLRAAADDGAYRGGPEACRHGAEVAAGSGAQGAEQGAGGDPGRLQPPGDGRHGGRAEVAQLAAAGLVDLGAAHGEHAGAVVGVGLDVGHLQQAGGWRSPTTAALYVRAEWARRGPVARRRYGVGQ